MVERVVVTGIAPGKLGVEFDGGLRSDRYYIELLVVGQDQAFRRMKTVRDEEATLDDLPQGADVQLRITGVNKVGEGPASQPVSVKVPAVPKVA